MNILKFLGILILLSIISYIFPFGYLIATGVYWYALYKLVSD
jgi:hypothetical protein